MYQRIRKLNSQKCALLVGLVLQELLGIKPNQCDRHFFLEKQFKQEYLKKYNNIYSDKKLKYI